MLTVSVTKSPNIKKNKDYKQIRFGEYHLHHYGTLCRLLETPEEYNPSLFAITRNDKKPICLASITKNLQRKGMCDTEPSQPLSSVFLFQFPNFEIMAYTNPDYRRKGIGEKTIKLLLKAAKVSVDDVIYVYSQSMVNILRRLGYCNVTNLHEYTP